MNEKQFLHHLNFIKESIEILKEIKNQLNTIYGILECDDIIDIKNSLPQRILLDSIAYRFSKIQSILGEKLFKETLEMLNIDTNRSFIEILSMLEQEKILPSSKEWINLRNLRNTLSHDYPDECEEIADTINEIFEKIDFFEKIYNNIFNTYKKIKELNENSHNK
ncbi:hypothetical protein [Caminibacter sp.]